MEFDATVEDPSIIRVAILAVGQIPPGNLRSYVDMASQYTEIDLKNIRPFYTEYTKSPFTKLNWESYKLRIKYMVGGAIKSAWEDFQVHRKIHGIIGLCHCPFSHDLRETYEQFVDICDAYPLAHVQRCFGFHPSHAQVEHDGNYRQDLILFPAVNTKELMEDRMHEFAASLIMEFEKQVLLADPTFTTPLDSQASGSTDELGKMKKKGLGRVQKTIGDYCLLAGSLLDANAHYTTATELSKLTGDILWQAGAAEGITSILMIDPKSDHSLLLQDVKARYTEIIQLYRRATALSFELEASLKLAKILCRKEFSKDVVEILTNCIESGKNIPEGNERLVLLVEISRIYEALGYHRKAAFFLREVAYFYLHQNTHWAALSALQVLHLASNAYGLSMKLEQGEWSNLQIEILGNMLVSALRGGDALAAWNAAAQLIRAHYPLITPPVQNSLFAALSTAAAKLPNGTRSSHPALPFLRFHSFGEEKHDSEFIKRTPGKKDWWTGLSRHTGPFIYTPFSSKQKTGEDPYTTWIAGETVHVLVEAVNPCAFEVLIESISLSVDQEFESFPYSFVLPPGGTEILSVFGRPLSPGWLTVRGCFVKYCGVITEHSFEGLKLHNRPFPKAKVLPPLPSLLVTSVGTKGDVVLYEGEVRRMDIEICNVSTVPVVEAYISHEPHGEQCISAASDALQAALPLNCGDKACVPCELQAGGFGSFSENTNIDLVIYYAGSGTNEEMPPGRRLCIPLRLRIRQGLHLVGARLLSMEIPLQLNRSLAGAFEDDPYKGIWNMCMLVLELWNKTDVVLDVTVIVKGKREQDDPVYESSQQIIDRDHCRRVLVPLEDFKLPSLGEARLHQSGQKTSKDVEFSIKELCTRIFVKWSSEENISGHLQLKDAISDAFKESSLEILFPDPLTFGFRIAREGFSSGVLIRETIPFEMLVRNNTTEDMKVSITVTCRDVTGACFQQTVLWGGALEGVEMCLCALGEAVHRFELCFLVPGEYTLKGVAVIFSSDQAQESICYRSPPFIIQVAALS